MRYIAYGSNLNKEQMAYRCPEASVSMTGFIKDYELLFKGSKTGSFLTIEPKKGSKVPVAIWNITEKDEKNLDRYEGFPIFYYKRILPVETEFGIFEGMVYIMDESRPLGQPSSQYVRTCLSGYEDFGFNDEYLYEAVRKSWKEIKYA